VAKLNRGLTEEIVGNVIGWSGRIIFFAEVGVLSARIFGLERKRQTLGSLMTLPPHIPHLIWQKIAGCLPAFIPSVTMWIAGSAIYRDYLLTQRDVADYYRPSHETYDTAFAWLVGAEFVLFAVLVAYLSLRMRRGPLLAGMSIMLFGNILAGILGDILGLGRQDEMPTWMGIMAVGAGLLALFLAYAIPGWLAVSAAEE